MGIVEEKEMPDESKNETGFQAYMPDKDGEMTDEEQSRYAGFFDWFCRRRNDVDGNIWRLFFEDADPENIPMDENIYSVFLKADELSEEGIKHSIKNVVNYIEDKLEKDFRAVKEEFQRIAAVQQIENYGEEIGELSEKIANKAVETVKDAYDGVETILAGVGLFKPAKELIDTGIFMEQFTKEITVIMDGEIERITEFIASEKQNYLEGLSQFPEINIKNLFV